MSFTYQIKLLIKKYHLRITKMEQLLKQLVNYAEPKRSFSIVISDNKPSFKPWFKPPIQVDKKKDFEMALINVETYYLFRNIDKNNNCFSYSPNLDPLWFLTLLSLKVVMTLEILMNSFNEK